MEKFGEWLKPKSEEELVAQEESVNENLGEQIVRPSEKAISEMSLGEIKEKYPRRYEIYLENLRAERRGEAIDGPEKEKMAKWFRTLNNLDNYIEKHKSDEDEQTLRERQFNVFEDLRDFLEHGENSGYIKLPTGVGKTVLFSEFIEATKLKTLVVVPTKILIGQTGEKLKEFAPELEVAKYFSEEKKVKGDVQIITYLSLIRQSKNKESEINPEDYDLLILDEAHKALSAGQTELIKGLSNQIKLGFTATPKYDEKKNLENLLGNQIHSMEVKEAIQEGLLSSCRVIIPKTEVDLTKIKHSADGKYNEKELEKAVNIETRNRAAVELYKQAFTGRSAIVFAAGVDHSMTLKETFTKDGISAEVITGETSQKERGEILEKYKSGEIKVLVGAQVFIEGFDEPRASVCLNLAPTTSQVVAEQRAGRVLRLDPNNTDKVAYVVDFLDKDENKRHGAISFAEILGGGYVENPRILGKGQIHKERGPKDLIEINIEGLEVIVDPEEVMAVVRKNIGEKYEKAKDGELTVWGISRVTNESQDYAKKLFDELRVFNKDWIQPKLDRKNRLYAHATKEGVKWIMEKINSLPEKAKEGDLNIKEIADLTGQTWPRTEKFVEELRVFNKDWIQPRIDKSGNTKDLVTPNGVRWIMDKINSLPEKAKKDELTIQNMADLTGRSWPYIKEKFDELRVFNKDWIIPKLSDKNHMADHATKEGVEWIMDKIKALPEKAREGELSLSDINKLTGENRKYIADLFDEIRILNYKWIMPRVGKSGITSDHATKEGVEWIMDKIKHKTKAFPEKAKEGEFSISDVVRLTSENQHYIKELFEDLRGFNKSWIIPRLGYKNRISDYATKEGVKWIVDKINSFKEKYKPASEGWLTIKESANDIGVSGQTIKKHIEQYRKSNKEWFEISIKNGHVAERLNPELVEIVKKEFLAQELPPDGWKHLTFLINNFKAAPTTIQKIVDPYRISNPEWFKKYKTIAGMTWHYAPKLIKIIEKDLKK